MFTREERKMMMDNIRFGHYDIPVVNKVGQMTVACTNDAKKANIIHYAVSLCSPDDMFNKKFGRHVCTRRINYLLHNYSAFAPETYKHNKKRECMNKCLIGQIRKWPEEDYDVFPDDICTQIIDKIAAAKTNVRNVRWIYDWVCVRTRRNVESSRYFCIYKSKGDE